MDERYADYFYFTPISLHSPPFSRGAIFRECSAEGVEGKGHPVKPPAAVTQQLPHAQHNGWALGPVDCSGNRTEWREGWRELEVGTRGRGRGTAMPACRCRLS